MSKPTIYYITGPGSANPDGKEDYSIVMEDCGFPTCVESGIKTYQRAIVRVEYWRRLEREATHAE